VCAVCDDDQFCLHLLAVAESHDALFAVYRCDLDAQLKVHLTFTRTRNGLGKSPQTPVEVDSMEAPRGGAHDLSDVGKLFIQESLEGRGVKSAGGNVGHALGFLAGSSQRLVTSSCFM